MRLYGAIQKVEPQDDGTVRVYGVATSEAVDEQGEIIRADAIRAAIPEYMRFPALREMHQLSAAGTTLEAEVGDDGATRIVAHVVDPVAVSKVKNQVYRGFSIGGRVTQRETGNPKTIAGLVLTEISLVDRPANPEAIFDCWKAAMASTAPLGLVEEVLTTDQLEASANDSSAQEPFNAPIQIWSCDVSAHRHLVKAEALKCMKSDAGLPKEKHTTGVPSAVTASDERAGSNTQYHGTSNDPALDERDLCPAYDCGRVGASEVKCVATSSWRRHADLPLLDGGIVKAKHSRADQALLDMAHFACDQCLKIGGLSIEEKANMDRTIENLQRAGAMPGGLSTGEQAEDDDDTSTSPDCPTLGGSEIDVVKAPGVVVERVCKRDRPHQNLMDLAHECLEALTDGGVCEQATKVGARHSQETLQLFDAAHSHLLAAGARCDPPDVTEPCPPAQLASEIETAKTTKSNTSAQDTEKAALTKVLTEIVPMIERLSQRVDQIARTPLPPLTIAKGTVAISKQQDRGSDPAGVDLEFSQEAIAAALAKMSKEEQTLTLIKASYATPIRIPGSSADPR